MQSRGVGRSFLGKGPLALLVFQAVSISLLPQVFVGLQILPIVLSVGVRGKKERTGFLAFLPPWILVWDTSSAPQRGLNEHGGWGELFHLPLFVASLDNQTGCKKYKDGIIGDQGSRVRCRRQKWLLYCVPLKLETNFLPGFPALISAPNSI